MKRFMIIFVWCCLLQAQATKDSPRIIIIGSGPAGIAAGSRLLENGFDNITILEAENRIGGRVCSTEFGGYQVDLGAQWVHGEENNAVFEMAWPLELLEKSSKERILKMFSSTGSKMSDDMATNLIEFLMSTSSQDIPEEYNNTSVGDWITHKLDEYFKEHSDIKTDQHEPLKKTFDLMEMALDSADSWFDVTTNQEYEICEGDQTINWKEKTYSTIIDILLKKYPNPNEELPFRNKTVLNAEVTRINYNNSDGTVRVVTENGDEYTADHVIVTPSLGVLKAVHEKLFNPPLTEVKTNAIKNLGFGSVAKIYLSYPEPWWSELNVSTFGLFFYWTDEDRNQFANDPNKSWLLGIYGVISVDNKPGLLCAWLTGPNVRKMEELSEEAVFTGIKELLHRFLGNTFNLTEPTAMLRSRWYSNKYFRGTYSFRSIESNNSGARNVHLAEPIMEQEIPRVMFAGEATSTQQSSTVHGAISTGWREADRLMKHYGHQVPEKVAT